MPRFSDEWVTAVIRIFVLVLTCACICPANAAAAQPKAEARRIADHVAGLTKLDGLFPLYWDDAVAAGLTDGPTAPLTLLSAWFRPHYWMPGRDTIPLPWLKTISAHAR